ncbi:unnamed protein product [Danaus chrysippus]|uniref:(African queen) hypothetical protein n=1 Tax=Danaus chrysippus TaxID=151541 RepID=A0A8J2R297_9NEOP|nr:unnamed protein product [Danaus chrysippus]
MAKTIVITILVVLCLLLEVQCGWGPLSYPYVSDYPCVGTNSIVSFFEPGVSSKAKTRYSVSINETFPTNSSIQIAFDSEAYVTLLVKTDDKKFSRVTMEPGVMFGFFYFVQETGFNFVVTSYVPGIVPYITSVKINDEEYCRYPNVGFLNQYVVETLINDEEKNCGRRQVRGTQLMVNGANTKPGDWPWHVAIYKRQRNIIKYICGGTLVSKNFVLTAAHCVSVRGSALLPDVISVVLGKYNLFGGDFGSEEKEVGKGTSACNGDSGGSLVVFVPDTAEDSDPRAEGTWHVKGIVSMTLSQKDVPICDPEQYVVFTDVEKYRVWIKSYIKEKENENVI